MAHHFLSIPEMVRHVLESADCPMVRSCVFVNKQWSHIALDIVWEVILEPSWISCVLAPSTIPPTISGDTSDLETEFSKIQDERIEADEKSLDVDWSPWKTDLERAESYFRRIKIIIFEARMVEDHAAILRELLKRYPHFATLFSNLHTFKWFGKLGFTLELIPLFIGPSILKLDLTVHGYNDSPATVFLSFSESISSRLEKLQILSFDLTGRFSVALSQELPVAFLELLKSANALKHLGVSHICITPQVFDAIGRLPNLEELQFFVLPQALTLPPNIGFAQSSTPFPSLERIHLATTVPDYRLFIAERPPAAKITDLYIRDARRLMPYADPSVGIESLVSDISNFCSYLQKLLISWVITNQEHKQPMTFLRPLLTSRIADQLSYVNIAAQLSFNFTRSDMETIAAALPAVQVLILNPAPKHEAHSSLLPPLGVLNSFAKHCHHLETLGLYLGIHSENSTHSDERFRALSCLNLGVTTLPDTLVQGVAIFLSGLLNNTCTIRTTFPIPKWQHVESLLPSLIKHGQQTT